MMAIQNLSAKITSFSTALIPAQRAFVEYLCMELDSRWPVIIEKLKAAVQAGAVVAT